MNQLIVLLTILLFVGCATTYQRQGFTGGFSETQLDENVFQVTFKGNAYTDRERAADFTLLRSAELAIEHNFNFFAVVDAQQYSKVGTYTEPTAIQSSTTFNGNTAYSSATASGGQTYVITKPRAMNTIICFKEKPQGFSYNAKFIVKSLREKYGLNE